MDIKSRLAQSREAGIRQIALQLQASPQLPRAIAVVPAAGLGARSGLGLPKQYYRLAGQTMLGRSIRALSTLDALALIVVVLSPDDRGWIEHRLDEEIADLDQVVAVAVGGTTRRESVMAGCAMLREAMVGSELNPWVLVHDAARPGLDVASLVRLWNALETIPAVSPKAESSAGTLSGAILATPVADTLKLVSGDAPAVDVERTVDRAGLWAAQTPQAFRLNELLSAYTQVIDATDEASAIENAGGCVRLVLGDSLNIKLTLPSDFELMESLIRQRTFQQVKKDAAMDQNAMPPLPPFAIGQGFDVHALVPGRPLIIGGVTIPFHLGLDGHSDADVLLHAITDAILGAAGMGDIGRHFPDTDPNYRGADSVALLDEVIRRVAANGWRVAQIDATVIAQAPKISPFAPAMVSIIAKSCGTSPSRINIKGKTTEKLGFTGRGEGIAAQAVAMLMHQVG